MMKRVLVALAMFPLVAQANELSVGTFELSGATSFGAHTGSIEVTDGGSVDTTDYGLSAAGLYYFTPNVAVGLSVDYSNSKEKANGFENGFSTLLLGPAIGFDFSVAPKLSLFGRGMIGYASSTFTETGSPDITPTGFGFGLEAGVKYFPVTSFSFDAGVGYDWVRLKEDPVEVTTSGVGVNLGLSVYFGGK